MTTKKIVVEVDDKKVPEVLRSLEKIGAVVRVEPDPEEVKRRILERWRKIGRRAKPGELADTSLEEEEFS